MEEMSINNILADHKPGSPDMPKSPVDDHLVELEKEKQKEAEKLRKDIVYFAGAAMDGLRDALELDGDNGNGYIFGLDIEGGEKRAGLLVESPHLKEFGKNRYNVFLVNIAGSEAEYAISGVDKKNKKDKLESNIVSAKKLDTSQLSVESLYALESGTTMTARTLNTLAGKTPNNNHRPIAATLQKDGDEYFGVTKDNQRYRVPMFSVNDHELKEGDKIALTGTKKDEGGNFQWGYAEPKNYYDKRLFR